MKSLLQLMVRIIGLGDRAMESKLDMYCKYLDGRGGGSRWYSIRRKSGVDIKADFFFLGYSTIRERERGVKNVVC